MPSRRRVLMMLEYYSHKMHLGIARYAKDAAWVLNASIAVTGNVPDGWDCDGIICFSGTRKDIRTEIQRQKKPVVGLSSFNPGASWPFIHSDQDAIGRMGAEHFLARGFQFFANLTHGETGRSGRQQGFQRRVEEAGYSIYDIPKQDFAKVLQNVPKPVAMMVKDDAEAIPIMDMITELGYSIPHDVAVLGVDDDELQNSLAAVPLSSIDTNAERRGYEAAKLLDMLMNGEPAPNSPIVIPPRGVVVRASTDVMAVNDSDVSRALESIRNQFADCNLNLNDVALAVGVCRYHLDNKFKKHLGYTMHEELMYVRLQEAARLLRDTDYRAKTIARLCGFSGTDHLSVTLKKKFGLRTREYRKSLN